MPERILGTAYRVHCPACDVERVVPSQVVAQDIVEGHAEQEYCDKAEWEVVDDD
jgi:hypothetical protein